MGCYRRRPQDGAAGLHKDYNCSCPNGACEWACKNGSIDYDPVKIILSANLTEIYVGLTQINLRVKAVIQQKYIHNRIPPFVSTI